MRFRDVRGCFRARVIYQMKEEKMGDVFMVVVFMLGRRWWRRGEEQAAAAREGRREVEDEVMSEG